MAEKYYTAASGNWSTAANWNGGTIPGSGDDVFANGNAITIDQDITCLKISTASGTTAVAGGSFNVSTNRAINANVVSGSTTCLSIATGTPTVSIVGNITGGSSASATGVSITTGATVTITGNATGGSNSSSHAITVNHASCVLSVIGNVTGGSGSSARGINAASCASLTCTGSVTGASGGVGIDIVTGSITVNGGPITGGSASSIYGVSHMSGTSPVIDINCDVIGGSGSGATGVVVQAAVTTCTVDGNVTAGSGGVGFHFSWVGASAVVTGNVTGVANYGGRCSNGSVVFNGNVIASTTNANGSGILFDDTGSGTINGNVTGGANASIASVGVSISSSGTITINGNVTAGAGGNGVTVNYSTPKVTVNGQVTGNNRGIGSSDAVAYGLSASVNTATCKVRSARCGANGNWPINGPCFISNLHQGSVKVRNSLLNEGSYELSRTVKGTAMGGDYQVGDIIYLHARFKTAPVSLSVAAYPDDSTTEITTGITVTYASGFDGWDGLVSIKVNTSSGYTSGKDYSIVATGGTVFGDSIAGEVLGCFSLAKQSLSSALGIRAAVGLSSANLDTQLGDIKGYTDTVESSLTTIGGYIDTEVAAIKAKTDNLPADTATVLSDMPKNVWNFDFLANIATTVNRYSPWNAMRHIIGKWAISGTTKSVYKEDGTTLAYTTTVTSDATGITGDAP